MKWISWSFEKLRENSRGFLEKLDSFADNVAYNFREKSERFHWKSGRGQSESNRTTNQQTNVL
jgi:hypothetical protein